MRVGGVIWVMVSWATARAKGRTGRQFCFEGIPPVRTYLSVVLPLLALAIAVPLLGACHTTAGVGEDMSAAGHAVSSEAKKLTP